MTTEPMPAMADEVTWGDRLRRIRMNRHMGQDSFAMELGVAKPTIGKYEVMTDPPRTRRLIENSVELRFGPAAANFLRGVRAPQPTVSGVRSLSLVPTQDDMQEAA